MLPKPSIIIESVETWCFRVRPGESLGSRAGVEQGGDQGARADQAEATAARGRAGELLGHVVSSQVTNPPLVKFNSGERYKKHHLVLKTDLYLSREERQKESFGFYTHYSFLFSA